MLRTLFFRELRRVAGHESVERRKTLALRVSDETREHVHLSDLLPPHLFCSFVLTVRKKMYLADCQSHRVSRQDADRGGPQDQRV
jgi:hypothetical protein